MTGPKNVIKKHFSNIFAKKKVSLVIIAQLPIFTIIILKVPMKYGLNFTQILLFTVLMGQQNSR